MFNGTTFLWPPVYSRSRRQIVADYGDYARQCGRGLKEQFNQLFSWHSTAICRLQVKRYTAHLNTCRVGGAAKGCTMSAPGRGGIMRAQPDCLS